MGHHNPEHLETDIREMRDLKLDDTAGEVRISDD